MIGCITWNIIFLWTKISSVENEIGSPHMNSDSKTNEVVEVKLSLCLIKHRTVKHVRECSYGSLPVCFTPRYPLNRRVAEIQSRSARCREEGRRTRIYNVNIRAV
jgi:hypothetical protein